MYNVIRNIAYAIGATYTFRRNLFGRREINAAQLFPVVNLDLILPFNERPSSLFRTVIHNETRDECEICLTNWKFTCPFTHENNQYASVKCK